MAARDTGQAEMTLCIGIGATGDAWIELTVDSLTTSIAFRRRLLTMLAGLRDRSWGQDESGPGHVVSQPGRGGPASRHRWQLDDTQLAAVRQYIASKQDATYQPAVFAEMQFALGVVAAAGQTAPENIGPDAASSRASATRIPAQAERDVANETAFWVAQAIRVRLNLSVARSAMGRDPVALAQNPQMLEQLWSTMDRQQQEHVMAFVHAGDPAKDGQASHDEFLLEAMQIREPSPRKE